MGYTKNMDGWESGLSAEKTQAALNCWSADPLPGGRYRMAKPNAELSMMLKAFGIDNYSLKMPTEPELRQLKHKVDMPFM
ncbi:MAG: hypothetical protein FWH51_06615 [Dehalococcoidia bacterium]|nr:hypothetical protein [Dehalococcoidia bacterium]